MAMLLPWPALSLAGIAALYSNEYHPSITFNFLIKLKLFCCLFSRLVPKLLIGNVIARQAPLGRPLMRRNHIAEPKNSPSLPLSTPTGTEKGRGGFKTRPYPAWLTKFSLGLPSGRAYDTIFLNRSVRIFSPWDSAGVWPTEALTLASRSLVGGCVLKMPLEAPAPLASMVVRRITMALGS